MRDVSNFVQFQLSGGPVWVDIEQVKAVTPAIDGGARLWLGGGDFFEVDMSPGQAINVVCGRPANASVRALYQVAGD